MAETHKLKKVKMAKKNDNIGEKVLTGIFRCAFLHVISPKEQKKGEPKYKVRMLFPKSGNDIVALKKAISALVLRLYPDKKTRPDLNLAVKDGDKPNKKGNIFDGHEGHWYAEAWSYQKPGIRSSDNTRAIIDPAEFYGGCYARATIVPFAWNNENGEGVSFFLNNIQMTSEGEPFGNFGGGGEADFDAIAPADKEADFDDDSDIFGDDEYF